VTPHLRKFRADNPGPFTFEGTVTFVLGREQAIVLDPGPDVEDHIRALARAVADARQVAVVLTHGHADHSGGVDRLLSLLSDGAHSTVEVIGAGHPLAVGPDDRAVVPFDGGNLLAVSTPGHTRDHIAWHWPETRALFAGDHILGFGDTTWVGEYPGCVADYLDSIERLRQMNLAVIHPGHGPSLDDPADALDRFEKHRRRRIKRVRELRRAEPNLRGRELFEQVYGDLVPAGLDGAARASLAALEEYVDTVGAGDVSSSV
jgi:glyoxylase-like metal-dependent hydrolase (beta-lactamase superfamily II)